MVVLMAVDTAIRQPFFADAYFTINNYCLLLAALLAVLIAPRHHRYIAWAVVGVMLNNLLDAALQTQGKWSMNDSIFTLLLPSFAIYGYVKRGEEPLLNRNALILAAVVPAKLLLTNIFIEFSAEKNTFFLGDALCYFLISLYALRTLKNQYFVIPALLLLMTANNLLDETLYDPVHGRTSEVIFVIWGFVMILWWKLRQTYGQDAEQKRVFNHIAIALNVVMLAAEAFLFLR